MIEDTFRHVGNCKPGSCTPWKPRLRYYRTANTTSLGFSRTWLRILLALLLLATAILSGCSAKAQARSLMNGLRQRNIEIRDDAVAAGNEIAAGNLNDARAHTERIVDKTQANSRDFAAIDKRLDKLRDEESWLSKFVRFACAGSAACIAVAVAVTSIAFRRR